MRKAVEAGVDKTGRVLAEWRSAQAKAKKQCYLTARDNEKVQDQLFVNKPRALTDKETAKIENKCKKTQDALRKVTLRLLLIADSMEICFERNAFRRFDFEMILTLCEMANQEL